MFKGDWFHTKKKISTDHCPLNHSVKGEFNDLCIKINGNEPFECNHNVRSFIIYHEIIICYYSLFAHPGACWILLTFYASLFLVHWITKRKLEFVFEWFDWWNESKWSEFSIKMCIGWCNDSNIGEHKLVILLGDQEKY